MKIKVSEHIIEINEKELIVKNGKLYNTKTKEYEGVEADLITISYEKDGKVYGLKGSVGGYTCGSHVVIRPNYEFDNVKEKKIEHIMPVVLIEGTTEEDIELKLMTTE